MDIRNGSPNETGLKNPSTLVRFNADAALAAAHDVAGSSLRGCAEFTPSNYHILYLSEIVLDAYDDFAAFIDMADDYLHSIASTDRLERDVGSSNPMVGIPRAFITCHDHGVRIRVYEGDQGLFLTVDRDVPVMEVVDAVLDEIRRD